MTAGLSLANPANPAAEHRRGRRRQAPPLWLVLAAALPVAMFCLPLAYVALRAWQAGPAGIVGELLRPLTLSLLLNTLVLGLGVTAGACLIGTAAAWCVERCDLPGRRTWRVAICLPLAVPAFVSSYAWSSVSDAFEGMAGAIFILAIATYPLVALPVAAALRGMDPAFEDVSRSLGRGPWETFFRVVLPQARPALGVGALLVLTHMFAEFGALALLRVQTFTTAIFASYELQFDSASAALQSAGTEITSLVAVGGGSRSAWWLKSIATALNVPVSLPEEGDFGAAFGAARLGLIAATGADPFAVCTPPRTARTIEPEKTLLAAYDTAYRRYHALYPALRPLEG